MRKQILTALGVAAIFGGPGAGAAWADFVCPVLNVPQQARDHSGQFVTLPSGEATILPGRAGDAATSPVNPPDHATNADGTGSPGGAHASPGDPDYSPIWNTSP
ncbi:MAG: hypothetical protein H0V20_02045 [Actinobacteria bacterium]|nr:hypothetical protein [Actinomycetota bacterium]